MGTVVQPLGERVLRAAPQPVDSPWQQTWRRFRRHRLAMVGLVFLLLLIFGAVAAPVVGRYDPVKLDLRARNQPPSAAHWFGTDSSGRDVWSRVIFGGRTSLAVGFVAVTLSTTIGVLIGSLAGYFGGKTDILLMRFTEIIQTFPILVVVIALVAAIGPGIVSAMIAIGALSWPSMARLVRGQFLTLKNSDYVLAARSLGMTPARIIARHMLPNAVGPIAVAVTFAISEAILLEAALSFFGLGVQIPTPSWGNMLQDARTISILETLPWLWVPPGLVIMLAVLAINFIGDGLRDALDPRMKVGV